MRYINRLFTYLLTYLLTYRHTNTLKAVPAFTITAASNNAELEGHSAEGMYLWQRLSDPSLNKTILKPRLAAAFGSANTNTWDFPDVIKFRVAAHTICEKFQHPDYNPDRAQNLICSSMSRRLSTRNISSKSMLAFLSNLANRQTDRKTDRQTNKHEKKHYLLRRR